MARSTIAVVLIAAAGLALSPIAHGQDYHTPWEGGVDLIYQGGKTLNFDGGTSANLESDFGFSIYFGYRATPHIEAQFAFDWSNADYQANLAGQFGGITTAHGSYTSFTPRVNVQFNLLDGPLTPYAVAGIGYSFIDTNIPAGRPQSGCWWDPWYGYVCGSVQPTKSVDGFAFQFGIGGRWDVSEMLSLKLAWERHWVDLGHGAGTPYLDQARLGATYRF
jgi:opacity protein-like surface antigen